MFMGLFSIKGQRVVEHFSLKYCIIRLVLLSESIYNCYCCHSAIGIVTKTKQSKTNTKIQKQPVSVIYFFDFFLLSYIFQKNVHQSD